MADKIYIFNRPVTKRWPYLPWVIGEAAIDLRPDDGSINQSASGPPLIQAVSVSGQDCVQSTFISEPGIIQVYSVTPADTSHDQISGEPSFQSTIVSSASSLTHIQTADEPSLSQVYQLIVDGLTITQALSETTVTGPSDVSIQSGLIEQDASEPSISQVYYLIVDSGAVTQSSDEIPISYAVTVQCDNTVHSISSSSLDLYQIFTFSDTAHDHAVESPVLDEIYAILSENALHLIASGSPALRFTEFCGKKMFVTDHLFHYFIAEEILSHYNATAHRAHFFEVKPNGNDGQL